MNCILLRVTCLLLLGVVGFPLALAADDKVAGKGGEKTATPKVTVAVLDFAANLPGNPDLGAQVAETLTATLSGETGFTLVDRSSLARTLQEHELNLTGLVSAEQATK